ncbi:MAG: GWxTD domain-containing protein [candidate division Zixibacteria bacterium]|nr:GWxTD domain-containing protein [candidate division Zixibacteria bacterium]
MFGRLFYIILILFLLVASSVFSETIGIQAGINVFNDPRGGTASYVEFPFSVKRYQFDFQSMGGENWLRASITANLFLTDTLGNKIDSVGTIFHTRVDNIQEASQKDVELFNKLVLYIEPGVYKAILNITDANDGKKSSFSYERFKINRIISDSLCMSDIELAKNIRFVTDSSLLTTSRFIKNGYDIIPAPMGIFNSSDTYVYIYAELYNLHYPSAANDSFALTYQIYKETGEIYFDFGKMTHPKPGSSAVITNRIDYSSWALGKYELRITATDIETGAKAKSVRSISIVTLPKQSEKIAITFRSPLDTASLETKSNWIRYIIDASDWEMFETLNDTGKSAFIERHFSDFDPSRDTPLNEYLLDVISRFNYANKYYSSLAGVKNGWKSDRGRVLLKYGLSDEIKTASPPSVLKPIEVWYYYSLQGGVNFVFEDSRGYSNYRLVHSNAKSEIYSAAYEEVINNYDTVFD